MSSVDLIYNALHIGIICCKLSMHHFIVKLSEKKEMKRNQTKTKKKTKTKSESLCKNVRLFIFIFDRKPSLISLNLYKKYNVIC